MPTLRAPDIATNLRFSGGVWKDWRFMRKMSGSGRRPGF